VIYIVLNDKFAGGLAGLVPGCGHRPWSHFL